ncbi:hypothetical protein niasHT_036168 [Heterodera trifolii]|uniref:Chromo domain-containing protein n=1 Tax=Heterodera trifolii TaxID=157864 RepID=A0ABD2IMR3_9BILA
MPSARNASPPSLVMPKMDAETCFCTGALYPEPGEAPDGSRMVVHLNCRCTGAYHLGCIAKHLIKRGGKCPTFCTETITENCRPTERWVQLKRDAGYVSEQEEDIVFLGEVRQPQTPPPPAAANDGTTEGTAPVRGRGQRTLRDNFRYRISAIVTSRKSLSGASCKLRVHWEEFSFEQDSWEDEAAIRAQAPLIFAAWEAAHDAGHIPEHGKVFPVRPASWMTNVRVQRVGEAERAYYPGRRRTAVRQIFDKN